MHRCSTIRRLALPGAGDVDLIKCAAGWPRRLRPVDTSVSIPEARSVPGVYPVPNAEDDPDLRHMPGSAPSSSRLASASAISSICRATSRPVLFQDDDAAVATEAPAASAPLGQPPPVAATPSFSLIPAARRSSEDPQAELPAGVRRRMASPRGTSRRADQEVPPASGGHQRRGRQLDAHGHRRLSM